MTIQAVALVDLDDTLFQTRRKCPPHLAEADLTPFAFTADGAPLSFATPAQAGFIAWLEATTHVVAVTARSVDALLRTRLRFAAAVAAHGGAIVTGRAPAPGGAARLCPDWHARMAAALAPHAGALSDLVAQVEADARGLGVAIRARVLAEAGLPLYVVVKHTLADGNDPELHAACAGAAVGLAAGWTAHVNGNNVAFMPPGLGKAHAVSWLLPALRRDHPGLPIIGIGDSLTDAGFMALCDFAMTPQGSQLASKLFAA